MVILAIRKGSRQIDANRIKNWQPPSAEKQFIFETVAEDKVMLKLEELDQNASVDENNQRVRLPRQTNSKRKFQDDGASDNNAAGQQNSPRTSWAQVAQGTGNRNNQNQQNGGGRYFNKSKNNFNNKGRSHNQFNNQNNPIVNPNATPTQPQNTANTRKQRGGNAGKGARGGFASYKSLDDYSAGGAGGFDGANDTQGGNDAAAAAGAMIMNY